MKKRKETLSIQLPTEVVEYVRAEANENMTSVAHVLRNLIIESLKRRGIL